TYLPSTFSKKEIEMREMEVIVEDYDRFFVQVRKEIEEMLRKGRAIIITFATQSSLDKFAEKLMNEKPNLNQYKGFKTLSDSLGLEERQEIVNHATRPFAVTLITRFYGRGTDFACFDQALVRAGGVHVVVTFLPEDNSEAKQILGRTCRQDDPGS
ncbi:hypothetical protein GUITHDRAFT_59939, partial [Guillardia theta CCMP2712]